MEKEGILRKRVPYFRVYQKFYCVLQHGRIDMLVEKTRELHGTIILFPEFTVSEVSRTHTKAIGSRSIEPLAFSIYNGENLLARFMADTPQCAKEWREAVLNSIEHLSKRPRSVSRRRKLERSTDQPQYLAEKAQVASQVEFEWTENVSGLNVFREINMTSQNVLMKSGCVINSSADKVLKMIVSDQVGETFDNWEERCDILEEYSEKHIRIEHVKWYPVQVFGMWTKPRDFVLQRYWMELENGCKMVTWRSCTHPKAPVDPSYVRANIWMTGFLITPQKRENPNIACEEDTSCWVDFCVHFSPEGWLGKLPKVFHEKWAIPLISRLTLLREAVERNKYLSIDYTVLFKNLQAGSMHVGGSSRNLHDKKHTGGRRLSEEEIHTKLRGGFPFFTENPLSTEPLRVRGATYLQDKKKIECTEPAFKVVAMDLFETEGRVTHIASRPDNLVHRLVEEGGYPFIFLVHFVLPGPPYYSFVIYFAAKTEDMTVGNPFGDLLNKFLNTDQEFRDQCFKFIPRVVKGNFLVKKAVGTTPAILGKKLKQEYYGDGETYFEVVVDVGSSSIAGSILGVVKGYATSLVIDLAFLLEGQQCEFLPEKILGTVRIVHGDLSKAVKLPFYAMPDVMDEISDKEE